MRRVVGVGEKRSVARVREYHKMREKPKPNSKLVPAQGIHPMGLKMGVQTNTGTLDSTRKYVPQNTLKQNCISMSNPKNGKNSKYDRGL